MEVVLKFTSIAQFSNDASSVFRGWFKKASVLVDNWRDYVFLTFVICIPPHVGKELSKKNPHIPPTTPPIQELPPYRWYKVTCKYNFDQMQYGRAEESPKDAIWLTEQRKKNKEAKVASH